MQIYVDNAATTKVCPAAVNAMLPCLTQVYGNPSSIHAMGEKAKTVVESARQAVAKAIGATPGEIYFTSGGTEADNWAINFAAKLGAKNGKNHIISSEFEHHAVLHSLKKLEKEGFEITLLPVYHNGLVRPKDLEEAIGPKTALVSIMFANNEIGTVQAVAELGAICRSRGVLFHTDAVQAVGHIPVDVAAQNIDLLSLSGHKFGGPKGVGALFCKKGLGLTNFIEGGAQEAGKRGGTENVPAIAGLCAALELACENMAENAKKMLRMRDFLRTNLVQIPRSRINGDEKSSLPGIVSVCFEGIEGEALLLHLDMAGICASSGSACTSGSLDPSHVLLALGLPHEIAHGSLRLSLCENSTDEEMEEIIKALPPIIQRLRDMSPMWERIMEEQN